MRYICAYLIIRKHEKYDKISLYEYAEEENFKDLWQSGRSRFSVLVLDKELRVIGETMLPKDTYRSDLVLVGERGLYFSENHYKNPSFDEDVLKFRLFRLENL